MDMDVLVDAITSQSFVEAVLVLVVTAALTGLLVPVVKARMDEKRLREQQLFEARLARQSKIIESQAALLESLAQTLWEFRMLMMELAFHRVERPHDRYQAALATYEDKAWDLFAKFRTEISEARRLTSAETHGKLRDLYYKTLIPLDRKLYELLRLDTARGEGQRDASADAEWQRFYDLLFGEITDVIDGVLNDVAEELRLAERGPG
jgi:hypothetical protein